MVAEYEERAPRVDKDIIKEEMDKIESQRAEIMSTIKIDAEKLDTLFPESMRIALKEQEKAELTNAINVISKNGSTDPKQMALLRRMVKKEEEKQREEDEDDADDALVKKEEEKTKKMIESSSDEDKKPKSLMQQAVEDGKNLITKKEVNEAAKE